MGPRCSKELYSVVSTTAYFAVSPLISSSVAQQLLLPPTFWSRAREKPLSLNFGLSRFVQEFCSGYEAISRPRIRHSACLRRRCPQPPRARAQKARTRPTECRRYNTQHERETYIRERVREIMIIPCNAFEDFTKSCYSRRAIQSQ